MKGLIYPWGSVCVCVSVWGEKWRNSKRKWGKEGSRVHIFLFLHSLCYWSSMCTLLNWTYTSVQHTPSMLGMPPPPPRAREKRTSAWMRRTPLQPCGLCFCHTRVWRAELLGQAALPGLAVPWIQHQKICFRAFRHFANRQQARGRGLTQLAWRAISQKGSEI